MFNNKINYTLISSKRPRKYLVIVPRAKLSNVNHRKQILAYEGLILPVFRKDATNKRGIITTLHKDYILKTLIIKVSFQIMSGVERVFQKRNYH